MRLIMKDSKFREVPIGARYYLWCKPASRILKQDSFSEHRTGDEAKIISRDHLGAGYSARRLCSGRLVIARETFLSRDLGFNAADKAKGAAMNEVPVSSIALTLTGRH